MTSTALGLLRSLGYIGPGLSLAILASLVAIGH